MHKHIYLWIFLTILPITATADSQRPEAQPSRELYKTESVLRTVNDFLGFESWGFHALSPENETYIKTIIHELDMDDYCIEIRGMSNLFKKVFGYANALACPSTASLIFGKKYHTYLFVSEVWFNTLSDQQK